MKFNFIFATLLVPVLAFSQGTPVLHNRDTGAVTNPSSAKLPAFRLSIGLGVTDNVTFGGLLLKSTNGVVDGNLNTAVNTTAPGSDPTWRTMLLGVNLYVTEDGAGYFPIDPSQTGWGLALERGFLSPQGALQDEAYFVTQGNERPYSVGFSSSLPVTVTSITNDGVNTTVNFTQHTNVLNYLRVGLRVRFRDLTAPTGVALNTPYLVRSFTGVNATSFILETLGHANIANGEADGGTLDRGGWGSTGSYVPFAVSVGEGGLSYSNYWSPDIPGSGVEPIAYFGNSVAGHGANVMIKNTVAGQSAVLSLIGGNGASNWGFYTLDNLTGPDFGLIESGAVFTMFFKAGGTVGIGNNTTPNANAILDLTSTTKAFMPPRMTKAQRDLIAVPTAGMQVYQNDNTPGLRTYNGTNWMRYTETAD